MVKGGDKGVGLVRRGAGRKSCESLSVARKRLAPSRDPRLLYFEFGDICILEGARGVGGETEA